MRYTRDPYWITARYAGTDRNGQPFKRGDRVFYYPATRAILAGDAAEQGSRDFAAAAFDETQYNT